MVVANNGINNTVGASASGITNTFTCTNPSNTASSAATIVATVGGATAGDAVYQASTTTTTWSWGCDNSVTSPTADPFVISQGTALGTTNIMSVATSGEINYPLQPSFLAVVTSTISNVTGDSTAYVIVFNSEVFDQNGDFSSTIFTAPVTGQYLLNACTYISGIVTHGAGYWTIGPSNRTFYYELISPVNSCTVSGSEIFSGCVLADMDAADTVNSGINLISSTKVIDILAGTTEFSGYLQG